MPQALATLRLRPSLLTERSASRRTIKRDGPDIMGFFDVFRTALARAEARIDDRGGGGLPMAFAKIFPGGLPGFLDALRGAGHEGAVASWLGSGTNVALAPEAYAALLSPEAVARFAADLGVPAARVPTALATFLPGAVDRQSRDGTLAPQRQFSTQVA